MIPLGIGAANRRILGVERHREREKMSGSHEAGNGGGDDTAARHPLRIGAHLVAILGVAALLRVCNLGTFSLWLDEILLVLRSRGTLAETWSACAAHGTHPPLSALSLSLGYRLGASDDLQRLAPILLGLGSIALLVLWVRTHFGATVAVASGWLAALSPYHIRYSQELRPYAYLLLLALLTLVVAEGVLLEPRPRGVVLCGLAMAGGLYSHNLFVVMAAPLLAAAATSRSERGLVRGCAALAGSGALALVLYLPWLGRAADLAGRPPEENAQTWTLRFFARLWQLLTVGGREGEDLSWGGALMLALAVGGLLLAARRWRRGGLVVLAGAGLGVAGVELFYHFAIRRWSAGRYEIIGWPFLVVAATLAVERLLRGRLRPFGVAVLVALAVAHVEGTTDYQARGREQWRRMAELVRLVRLHGEPVLTESLFSHYGLVYYLCGPEALLERLPPDAPVPLNQDLDRLRRLWPRDRSCLLVRGGAPESPQLRRLASHFPLIASYADRSWLYRLPPQARVEWNDRGGVRFLDRQQGTPWPPPSLVLLPERLRDPRWSFPDRVWSVLSPPRHPTGTVRLDFEHSTASALLSGWSGFERDRDGTSFVWATGLEAGLLLHCSAPGARTLRVVLRPFPAPDRSQRVRGFFNRHLLGEATLEPGFQTLEVTVPPEAVQVGRNLLLFQFAYAVPPAQVVPGSHDWRPLACAFDHVELGPAPAPAPGT